MELRLHSLHRELYTALLRPSETFARDRRTMSEAFWPDLHGTSIDALLEAFFYYFLRKVSADVSVSDGLSVLRAVFFNHSATDPSLWIYSAEQRLAELRMKFPTCKAEVVAPPYSRWQDMAFVINSSCGASPAGRGWSWGNLRRRPDGLGVASVECGVDPSIAGSHQELETVNIVGRDLAATLGSIFGWQPLGAVA